MRPTQPTTNKPHCPNCGVRRYRDRHEPIRWGVCRVTSALTGSVYALVSGRQRDRATS